MEFFSIYPDTRPPEPASRDLRGSLPARAAQVCTPITTASGVGWYLFPPVDFALRWDGDETFWSLLEDNEPARWRSLAGGRDGVLPSGADAIAAVPEGRVKDLDIFDRLGGLPAFIDADPRSPERVEVITGLLARTRPGWLLSLREPPNWPRTDGVHVYEGLIECEWYRSFLPTILRLTTQGKVVRFYRHLPLMVAQVIPTSMVEANRGSAPMLSGMADFPDDVWDDFVELRRARQDPTKPRTYVSRQRDRRRASSPDS
ncbi:DUF6065 family protein [Mangrovihabitans endophyticus]|uniref:DUF6065 family protein n=1 Tax=Mangrovihabitans endophyticus TaxID=1751298 RepID=UPI00166A67B2|nr:DUF6065 family protein [Mangrovihabitans endophyticus]